MTTHSAEERQALAEALRQAGPDAPTLCEGWTAADLAAHVVAREERLDSGAGLLIPAMAGWTERVRARYARRPFDDLVERIRSGPGRTSWAALPRMDATLNLTEHFVHCEDVRRAAPAWSPRELPASRQEALWRILRARGRMFFRRSPVGVTLVDSSGRSQVVNEKDPMVLLKGEPAELMLFAFGRGAGARVDLEGPGDAVEALRDTRLGV